MKWIIRKETSVQVNVERNFISGIMLTPSNTVKYFAFSLAIQAS